MRSSIGEAKKRLAELVRLAEAGEEVVLTRYGKETVRLVPVRTTPDAAARGAVINSVQATAAHKRTGGPSAARSQDFLYGEDGLPK